MKTYEDELNRLRLQRIEQIERLRQLDNEPNKKDPRLQFANAQLDAALLAVIIAMLLFCGLVFLLLFLFAAPQPQP